MNRQSMLFLLFILLLQFLRRHLFMLIFTSGSQTETMSVDNYGIRQCVHPNMLYIIYCTFLNSLGSITEELSLQKTRYASILSIVGTRFIHECDEEMHVKSLSQGLKVDLAQPGLELVTSCSRNHVSTTTP